MMKSNLRGPVTCVTDMIHSLRLDDEVESMWHCYMGNRFDPQFELSLGGPVMIHSLS